ncbi:unnamed protein product [Protopolystoma xenopodis]|uniref:Uncharacterized protein n=1 Tax=Protopolystoma xenopodis TaxID=117903 RepID=A0A448WS43_9PLAT|nr:unnamed protein product [Protopolystoma xenopodis]
MLMIESGSGVTACLSALRESRGLLASIHHPFVIISILSRSDVSVSNQVETGFGGQTFRDLQVVFSDAKAPLSMVMLVSAL